MFSIYRVCIDFKFPIEEGRYNRFILLEINNFFKDTKFYRFGILLNELLHRISNYYKELKLENDFGNSSILFCLNLNILSDFKLPNDSGMIRKLSPLYKLKIVRECKLQKESGIVSKVFAF